MTDTIKPESPPQDAVGFPLTEAEMIEGRREWLKQLAEKTAATKSLLLEGRDDDASTEAIFDMWCDNDDRGRLDFLMWAWFHRDRIGRRPWSRLLAYCWMRPKVGSLVTNWGAWGVRRVTVMFERAVPEWLMEPDDLAIFQSLPDRITIYRGCYGISPGKARRGMSWTLDLKKARWFATRFYQPDPIVVEATSLKPDVLAYFNERNERELVVRPGVCARRGPSR